MTFHIGERVVYPNHGVGTVENISTRNFGPRPERFYLLKLAANSLTVMIPFSHVHDVGLRKVTKNCEIGRVLDFLSAGRCKCCNDWKNRFKENSEKMRVGGLLEVAEVLKTLLLQQKDKPLSFREKKMLDRARHLLITEVSISRAVSLAQAVEILRKALGRATLTLPEAL
ncbi:MAG: CarD family transcriptional regulator [Acidobacteriia bacterium]|nr:CarD family transcriptional regulator [Terriglobia bacterium]